MHRIRLRLSKMPLLCKLDAINRSEKYINSIDVVLTSMNKKVVCQIMMKHSHITEHTPVNSMKQAPEKVDNKMY